MKESSRLWWMVFINYFESSLCPLRNNRWIVCDLRPQIKLIQPKYYDYSDFQQYHYYYVQSFCFLLAKQNKCGLTVILKYPQCSHIVREWWPVDVLSIPQSNFWQYVVDVCTYMSSLVRVPKTCLLFLLLTDRLNCCPIWICFQ